MIEIKRALPRFLQGVLDTSPIKISCTVTQSEDLLS